MNIDLLIADDNEIGLALDEPFGLEVRVIVFRRCAYILEARFKDGDSLVFNIPVEEDYAQRFGSQSTIHLSLQSESVVTHIKQVPFTCENGTGGHRVLSADKQSVQDFERFRSRVQESQPIHREDIEDESMPHSLAGERLPLSSNLIEECEHEGTTAPARDYQPYAPRPKWAGPAVRPPKKGGKVSRGRGKRRK